MYTATEAGCTVNSISPMEGDSLFDINIGLVMQWHCVGLGSKSPKDVVISQCGTQAYHPACSEPPKAPLCCDSDVCRDNQSQRDLPCCDSNKQSPRDSPCCDSGKQSPRDSPCCDSDKQSPRDSPYCDSDNDNQSSDDIEIDEDRGDQYSRQITGGLSATMMSVEDPEAFAEIVCLAPGEGQMPLYIFTDEHFESMSNPDKFPYGKGCFSDKRPCRLTYKKYFNQRLLNVDSRFASDTDYLFTAQYIVEAKQILDDCNHFIWRQKPGTLTAGQAKDQAFVSQCLRKDKAYRFMKNVRGSPPYYRRTFYEMLAMIRQLGTPTWFFTLSAADLKWPDIIQTIARQYGDAYTDEQVAALSFEEKSSWIRRNPVTAARHFQYRLNTFFSEFLKSPANPLGEIVDHAVRIEFQNRGSPHAHRVLWVKNAPKYDENPTAEVCAFIDKYISVSIPDNGELKDLVLQLQQHRHSSYCKRHNTCRFKFPHPPSDQTLIAEAEGAEDPTECLAIILLKKVRKVLAEGDCDSMTTDELLAKACVTHSEYEEALGVATSGSVVVHRRKPSECNINNYNPNVLLAWQANMDIQYVLNAYACVMYVASYIMKIDCAMGELLRRVADETRTEDLKTQMKKVGAAFLSHRELSAQEAAYRILPLPMKSMSRPVVFVDTNLKKDRISVLKDNALIQELDDSDPNVFCKSLLDRYEHRPLELQNMCLAEFAANYSTDYNYKAGNDDISQSDVLPSVSITDGDKPHKITLTDGFGKMNKRRHEAVIGFRRFNREKEPSNWFRAKLMLYFPWCNEEADLLGGYSSYEEHYRKVHTTVSTNEKKYTQSDIEDIEVDENGPPQHVWDQVAPGTEASRAQHEAEGSETLTELSEQDVRDNINLFTSSTTSSVHVHYEVLLDIMKFHLMSIESF